MSLAIACVQCGKRMTYDGPLSCRMWCADCWSTPGPSDRVNAEAEVARLTVQLADLRQAFDTYAGIAESKIAGLEAAATATTANQRLREALEQLQKRAPKEPLGIDISDYGDEWCAGFLAGQENALTNAQALP